MKEKIPAFICDLDGTLYNSRARQEKFLLSGKKDFDGFHKAAKHDEPHYWCAQILQSMRNAGFLTIFTSGRDDTYRDETIDWLHFHLGWKRTDKDFHYLLLMRPAGDFTPDDDMKAGWYRELIEPTYDVLFALDDRKRVAQMWRREGLTCLHCAEGDF